MENLLQVGIITSTHGIKGEVKVFPTTDDANRFKKLKEVLLDTGKETFSLRIESVKFFKQFVISMTSRSIKEKVFWLPGKMQWNWKKMNISLRI